MGRILAIVTILTGLVSGGLPYRSALAHTGGVIEGSDETKGEFVSGRFGFLLGKGTGFSFGVTRGFWLKRLGAGLNMDFTVAPVSTGSVDDQTFYEFGFEVPFYLRGEPGGLFVGPRLVYGGALPRKPKGAPGTFDVNGVLPGLTFGFDLISRDSVSVGGNLTAMAGPSAIFNAQGTLKLWF